MDNSYIVVNSMKKSQGEFNGKSFDFTKIYCYVIGDSSDEEKEKGYFVDEINIGKSFEFDILVKQGIKFPALCSANVQKLNTSRGYKLNISDVTFIREIDFSEII